MKKGIAITLIAICAIIFCVSAYQLIGYYSADRAAEKEFAELLPEDIGSADAGAREWSSYDYMLPYYKSLREENGDMVGWLRIPGTRINYPVMQTIGSPEYYLDKNFEKEYSASGSLFANHISDVDEPSDVVTIYGHRMKTGAMFGSLGDFLKEDFLKEHDTIIFDTFAGRNIYKVYGAFSLSIDTGHEAEFDYYNYSRFVTKDMFDRFSMQMALLMQTSNTLHTPIFGDKLLLLSTCEYTHENGRLLVVAVRE